METVVLKVTGMTCGHCAKAVTSALTSVPGVTSAHVDLEQASAVVEYDSRETLPAALAAAVMDEGYTAKETT